MGANSVIFTVGRQSTYEPYIDSDSNAAKAKGGSVWKTAEEAAKYAPLGFSVYGVEAVWEEDTEIDFNGEGWHRLKKDSKLIRVARREPVR
jgi:hypothetical protein